MTERLAAVIEQQVLFRDIGDVGVVRVLGVQVIERLFFRWADLFGDRQPPFFGIREFGIDIEDDAAKRE